MEVDASTLIILVSVVSFVVSFLVTLFLSSGEQESRDRGVPRRVKKLLERDILKEIMEDLDQRGVNTSESANVVTEFLHIWTDMVSALREAGDMDSVQSALSERRGAIDALVVRTMQMDSMLAQVLYDHTTKWMNEIQFGG